MINGHPHGTRFRSIRLVAGSMRMTIYHIPQRFYLLQLQSKAGLIA